MKVDLYRLSNRLCKAAALIFLICWIYPAVHWLIGFAAVFAIAGLVTMLADEIIARKQRERTDKPATVSH